MEKDSIKEYSTTLFNPGVVTVAQGEKIIVSFAQTGGNRAINLRYDSSATFEDSYFEYPATAGAPPPPGTLSFDQKECFPLEVKVTKTKDYNVFWVIGPERFSVRAYYGKELERQREAKAARAKSNGEKDKKNISTIKAEIPEGRLFEKRSIIGWQIVSLNKSDSESLASVKGRARILALRNANRNAADHIKSVNADMGLQWLFSFLSADKKKTYCLYEAPSAELIRENAKRLGLPADVVMEVSDVKPEMFV